MFGAYKDQTLPVYSSFSLWVYTRNPGEFSPLCDSTSNQSEQSKEYIYSGIVAPRDALCGCSSLSLWVEENNPILLVSNVYALRYQQTDVIFS